MATGTESTAAIRPPVGLRRVTAFLAAGAPRAAVVLTYGALLPLAAGLVIAAAGGIGAVDRAAAIAATAGWGAILLGLVGGVRWGRGMRVTDAGGTAAPLAAGIAALVAWAALLLPPSPALALLATAFAAQGAWDAWDADRGRLPAWYGRLRIRTTVPIVALLAGALLLSGPP